MGVITGRSSECNWSCAACGGWYNGKNPKRVFVILDNTGVGEAKVFHAPAPRKGACENFICACKLLADQQVESATRTFIDTTEVGSQRWKPPLVDQDWHAICQAIYIGVEGTEWERLYLTFVQCPLLQWQQQSRNSVRYLGRKCERCRVPRLDQRAEDCQLGGGPSGSLEQARGESSVGFGGRFAKSRNLRRWRVLHGLEKQNLKWSTTASADPPCRWLGGDLWMRRV